MHTDALTQSLQRHWDFLHFSSLSKHLLLFNSTVKSISSLLVITSFVESHIFMLYLLNNLSSSAKSADLSFELSS